VGARLLAFLLSTAEKSLGAYYFVGYASTKITSRYKWRGFYQINLHAGLTNFQNVKLENMDFEQFNRVFTFFVL
jgi:ribosome biogenesis protein Tsr3